MDDAHPVEDLGNFLQQIKFEHPSFCLWYDNTSYNETTNAVIKHFLSQSGGMVSLRFIYLFFYIYNYVLNLENSQVLLWCECQEVMISTFHSVMHS